MIKPMLVCALLVGGAAYPVHLFLQPPDFGVSPEEPIGKFENIEAFVQRWDHYRRSVGKVDEDMAFDFGKRFEGQKKYDFEWKEPRVNGYPRVITVVFDGRNMVTAIHARFPTKTQEPMLPDLTSGELMWRLWTELAGRTPKFKRTKGENGVLHVDSFSASGVKGTWTKAYRVPGNERSICDAVAIYRTGQ
jgi:hypothetical protein